MNKQEFINLIQNPQNASSNDYEKLEEVVSAFPYCQSAHLLIAKITHDQSSMLAKQKLTKAAAYTLERKRLRKIILANQKPGKAVKSSTHFNVLQEEMSKGINQRNNYQEIETGISLEKSEETIKASAQDEGGDFSQIRTGNEENNYVGFHPPAAPSVIKDLQEEKIITPEGGQQKTGFFEELERNLQNLKKLKEQNKSVLDQKVDEPRNSAVTGEEKGNEKEPSADATIQQKVKEQIILVPIDPKIYTLEKINKVERQPGNKEEKEEEVFKFNSPTTREEDVFITAGDGGEQKQYEILLQYLNYLSAKKKKKNIDKDKINNIIDKFIIEDPTIPYFDVKKNVPELENKLDLSEKSLKPSGSIASESFAKILIKQGKIQKAITIYQELILKNPEKKAYFTNQIEELNKKL